VPEKSEKLSNLLTQVRFEDRASVSSHIKKDCTGKIESISNAASLTSEVCVDKSVDLVA
jgi:hypothetical protein